jgi:hypothetical protein
MVPVGCRVHEESCLDVFFVCSASALRRDKLALFLYNMHTYILVYRYYPACMQDNAEE